MPPITYLYCTNEEVDKLYVDNDQLYIAVYRMPVRNGDPEVHIGFSHSVLRGYPHTEKMYGRYRLENVHITKESFKGDIIPHEIPKLSTLLTLYKIEPYKLIVNLTDHIRQTNMLPIRPIFTEVGIPEALSGKFLRDKGLYLYTSNEFVMKYGHLPLPTLIEYATEGVIKDEIYLKDIHNKLAILQDRVNSFIAAAVASLNKLQQLDVDITSAILDTE